MNDNLRKQQHFLNEVEQTIMLANREVIHQDIDHISRDTVLGLAVTVSRVRASYLKAILAEAAKREAAFSDVTVKSIRAKREQYEEAVQAFEALRHAIERGYVELDGVAPSAPETTEGQ